MSEFVVLILVHSFSSCICLLWCTKFRGLTIPTKSTKIGIQANKNEFSVIFEYNVIKLNTLIGHTISDLELI
jgi:hypothetical protein